MKHSQFEMKNVLLLYFCLVFIFSCHDTITVIKGCCEEPAVRSYFGDGKIFVPNVFTPNGDGINDKLIIYGDSVEQIEEIEIKNEDGIPVFHNLHLPVNDYNTAWDGKSYGIVVRGLYSFVIRAVSISGYIWTIKGNVCICPCSEEIDEDLIPIRNCEFAVCDTFTKHCDPNEYLPCFEY